MNGLGPTDRPNLETELLGDTIVDAAPAALLAPVAIAGETVVHPDADHATPERRERLTDPFSRIGSSFAGRYLLTDLLGAGGMGAVYRAKDLEGGGEVAVKVLRSELAKNPEAARRFLREARAAEAVKHDNVVGILDAGLDEQTATLFMVLELLEGETAANRLERTGRFSLDEVLDVARGALEGLGAAHAAGIIHRDMKPENVFLTHSGVKLIDFGIAKALPGSAISMMLTVPGAVLGTPHYLSPEQARGMSDLDQRVDIYALGVVMYELLSGVVPFDKPGYIQVLSAVCSESPLDLGNLVPELPPEMVAIVRRAMARDRERRFATAQEMLGAIEAFRRREAEDATERQPTSSSVHETLPSIAGSVLVAPTELRARLISRSAPFTSRDIDPVPLPPGRLAATARLGWLPLAAGVALAAGLVAVALIC